MNEICRRFARAKSRAHEPALGAGASLRTLFLAEPALIRAGLPYARSALGALFLMLFAASAPLHAQIVRGQVVDSVTQVPLAQATIALIDRDGAEQARTVTDDEGRFLLRAPAAGEFHLRVELEGYRSSTFPPFALTTTEMKAFMLLIADLAPPPNPVTPAEVIGEVCPAGTCTPR